MDFGVLGVMDLGVFGVLGVIELGVISGSKFNISMESPLPKNWSPENKNNQHMYIISLGHYFFQNFQISSFKTPQKNHKKSFEYNLTYNLIL